MSGKFDLVGIGMTSQRTRNRLVARLREADLLTSADTMAMRLLCEASVTANVTYALLQAEGFAVDGRKNPLHMVYAEAVKTMRALFDQFGLTPMARLRLKSPEKPKEENDPLDFLN